MDSSSPALQRPDAKHALFLAVWEYVSQALDHVEYVPADEQTVYALESKMAGRVLIACNVVGFAVLRLAPPTFPLSTISWRKNMLRTYPPGYCPDRCSGGQSDRQMTVQNGLLNQLPDAVRAAIAEHGGAKRCTYCGLVYLSPPLQIGSRLGFWNAGVRGQGWAE